MDGLLNPSSTLQVIKQTPALPDFKLTTSDLLLPSGSSTSTTVTTNTRTGAEKTLTGETVNFTLNDVSYFTPTSRGQDSLEAQNFRKAAIDLTTRLSFTAPVKQHLPFNVDKAYRKLKKAINPKYAFPRQIGAQIVFPFSPDWILDWQHLIPAMEYPDFDDPMYEKLRNISSELLIPNLHLIPDNTISLLETNPPFIESYMVGLNHEMGRELLWREYPTDRRGSYFRQFWDTKGIITSRTDMTQEELAELAEENKDILPIDQWDNRGRAPLGTHNKKNPAGKKQLVMVIKGELLKKYPNTIIYAQKAHPKPGQPAAEPIISEVTTDAEMKLEIKFPIFRAEIDPNIRFAGFDMTIEQAKGQHPSPGFDASDTLGWYFIIQEVPGEARFGMDITDASDDDTSTPITWDDLSWVWYDPAKSFIETTTRPQAVFRPTNDPSRWGKNSAEMAYILCQKPVMVAVHAKEMLENL